MASGYLVLPPTSNVLVPISSSDSRKATVSPPSLLFTPENWSVDQTVTATGQDNCAPGANLPFQIQPGKAVTLDPNFIGLKGSTLNISHNDDSDLSGTTNNSNLHICGLVILKEEKVNKMWQYTLTARLSNTGAAVNNISATLAQAPSTVKIIDGTATFVMANQRDTITSDDTVIVQSPTEITKTAFKKAAGFVWAVTTTP